MDFDQKEATGNPSKALEASSPHLAPSPPGTNGHPPLPIHSHQPTAPPGQLSSNSTASVNTSIFCVCVCVGFCLGLVPPHPPPFNSEQTSFCSHCPCPHPSAPDWQGNPIPTLPAEKCLLLQQSQQKPTAKHSLLHNKSLTLSISFCSFPPFPQPSASIPSDY